MKILLAGDTHGNPYAIQYLYEVALQYNCDRIFQLGDYGFWEHQYGGPEFLDVTSEFATLNEIPFYWLDGNHECVTTDTLALTNRGWKGLGEILETDLVLSLGDNKEAIWQPIDKIVSYDYDGPIIRTKGKCIDMALTPNHRVVGYSTGKQDWIEMPASSVAGKMFHIPTSSSNSKIDYPISDALIELLGICVTDGHLTLHGYWKIYQRENKIDRIKSIIEACGLTYKMSTRQRDTTQIMGVTLKTKTQLACEIRLGAEQSRTLPFVDKHTLPEWVWQLSERQVRVFVDALVYGDGSYATDNSNQTGVLYCNSDILREQLEILLMLNGFRVSTSVFNSSDNRLNFCRRTTVIADARYPGKGTQVSEESYKGKVWCLQVPNGRFFAKHNGKSFLTGNCHTKLRADYSDKIVDDGMWEIRPNLYYSPRGNRFAWDNVDFMSFGGAFSIDRDQRRVGSSFWFEEEIEAAEIDEAIKIRTPVNILLAHDLPAGVDLALVMANKGAGQRYRVIKEAEKGRQQLRRLVQAIRPTHIYHGHYHINYVQYVDYGYGQVKVMGLNCDGSGQESWSIIDTQDFQHANGL